MILFQKSNLHILNGDEVLAIVTSINYHLPVVVDARSLLLHALTELLEEYDEYLKIAVKSNDTMVMEGKITPEQAQALRPTSNVENEIIRATIEKVKILSEIECTYLLGLVNGVVSGQVDEPLATQWDNSCHTAKAMNR
ncbi:MAG: hypothetical protein VR70_05295 [Rhodospirillaceae bacterium BRH_c57]|nr:MAG: hypothetical protein VR70_05295 [Rhodospirillaceae bacterium BRH_c57]